MWALTVLLAAVLLPAAAVETRRMATPRGPAWIAQRRARIGSHVTSPVPVPNASLPAAWDWRYDRGPGLVSRVLTQQAPHVCGSCWAEAAMGALSDRYRIATAGAVDVQLAVQVLLNFNPKLTGGDCSGGDALGGFKFVHRFGITDDTCATFLGADFGDNPMGETAPDGGSTVNPKKQAKETEFVRTRMCHFCDWNGNCDWLNTSSVSDEVVALSPSEGAAEVGIARRYSVDEYGEVSGIENMMAEIYARGPIVCSIDSAPDAFNKYVGGVIQHPAEIHNSTDHDIVIAGWGRDAEAGLDCECLHAR